jgi:hypothetical protein
LLLGLDFLENHDTVIDLKSYTVLIDSWEIPIKQIKDKELKKASIYKVSVQKRTVIPPNTMKFVKLKTDIPCQEILAIQPQNMHNELLCPNSVISPDNPYDTVRNLSSRYITVKKNAELGVGIEVDEICDSDRENQSNHEKEGQENRIFNINKVSHGGDKTDQKLCNLPSHLLDMFQKVTSKLSGTEIDEVENILMKFQHVFAKK